MRDWVTLSATSPCPVHFPVDPITAVPFRAISGAAISANASTPLSTDPFASAGLDKASTFESSNLFSSIPLQPIPKNSKSGPISHTGSGPIERGFLSGPLERSFFSEPLENHNSKPESKTLKNLTNFRRVLAKSLWGFSGEQRRVENDVSTTFSGTCSTITSHNLSSDLSFAEEYYDLKNESVNLQWALGKAGEDRVHLVVSEAQGWVFVGIYDGFNGPDATDFLLTNLYLNVSKELKGLLWSESDDKQELFSASSSRSLDSKERSELNKKLRNKLINLGHETVSCNDPMIINHLGVLKALSEALKKTESSFLRITDMMLTENPELALMGSCVLVMVMKGDDLYLMNVGDSRGVLAQKEDKDSHIAKMMKKDFKDSIYGSHFEDNPNHLSCYQLTMDHSTDIKEEVKRIRNEHPDDPCAIYNDRVKGSLKVTRAFGAGFLKQPKWNEGLLNMFRVDYIGTSPYITCSPSLCHHRLDSNDKFLILSSDGLFQYFTNEEAVSEVELFMKTFPEGDPAQHLVEEVLFRAAKKAGMDFHELLGISQGERRKYHDDVSIVIISFQGRIWRSSF